MSYPLGSLVPLSIVVRDAAGAVVTTADVSLTITQPDGTNTVPGVQTSTPGTYYVDFAATQAGRHLVRWTTSGTVVSAYSDVFEVDSDAELPLVSLTDMKSHLNIPPAQTTHDAELLSMGTAITDIVESALRRPLRRKTVTDTFDGTGASLLLRHVPCPCATCQPLRLLEIVSVTEDGLILGVDDYILDSGRSSLRRGVYGVSSWSGLRSQNIAVTYVTGYRRTPPWARLAVLRALENTWTRSQQRPHPGFSQGADAEYAPSSAYVLPYAVQSLIAPHAAGPF